MTRQVYFVIAVDLDDKTVRIDDDTFVARFSKNEQVWDDETSEWRDYADDEYENAVAILNEKRLEND